MGQSITIKELQAVAEKFRKEIRAAGGFPPRRRTAPRSKEKDDALFSLRLNACVKYGIRRFPDGTFRLQEKNQKCP
jgi:hypothetical protein